MHPDPVLLGLLHGHTQVLVAGHEDHVGHRPVPRQRHQVGVQLGVHALLLRRPLAAEDEVAQTHLHVPQCAQHTVLGGGLPLERRVVPVDPQHRQPGLPLRADPDRLDQRGVVGAQPAAVAPEPGEQRVRSAQQVSRIDQHGASVHGVPLRPHHPRRCRRRGGLSASGRDTTGRSRRRQRPADDGLGSARGAAGSAVGDPGGHLSGRTSVVAPARCSRRCASAPGTRPARRAPAHGPPRTA